MHNLNLSFQSTNHVTARILHQMPTSLPTSVLDYKTHTPDTSGTLPENAAT